MEKLFFDNWESILRTLAITVMAYCALIIMLRLSGKRTLSKMNAFDMVVTFALGSSMATVALNKSVTLADGALVFLVLILLQLLITKLSVKFPPFRKLVTSEPALLLFQGKVLHRVLRRERITMDELYSAARRHGYANLSEIDAMIFETTGQITVIGSADKRSDSLKNVRFTDRV